eukprot:COSAG01_NODE_1638_length_9653_cov_230.802282_7_plen_59_part_00
MADSHCGVKLGAENSLSGFNHCVISSKTTVWYQYQYWYHTVLPFYCTGTYVSVLALTY